MLCRGLNHNKVMACHLFFLCNIGTSEHCLCCQSASSTLLVLLIRCMLIEDGIALCAAIAKAFRVLFSQHIKGLMAHTTKHMTKNAGILVYMMGPSGVGKDTLIQYAQTLPSTSTVTRPLFVARRYITRPLDKGGEQHLSVSKKEFAQALAQNMFAMHWQSHGLYYGVDKSIDHWLMSNALVLVNGSRAFIPQALQKYPQLVPVLVQAHPECLQERLVTRGRDSAPLIASRIRRANLSIPAIPTLRIIDNSGPLEHALAAFKALLVQLDASS